MKTSYKKRFLSLFLSLTFILGMIPNMVYAADSTQNSWPGLSAAFTGAVSGDTIKLIGDITYNEVGNNTDILAVPNATSLTLDLNGHKLSLSSASTAINGIKIGTGSTLTIKDSSALGNGELSITTSTSGTAGFGASINTIAGTLKIESGKVTVSSIGSGLGEGTPTKVHATGGSLTIAGNAPGSSSDITSDGTVLVYPIKVKATDASNSPLANATIAVGAYSAKTDATGTANIYLPIGATTISTSLTGYSTASESRTISNSNPDLTLTLYSNSENRLSNLEVKNGATPYALTPAFNKDTANYTLTVPNPIASVNITSTTLSGASTVTQNVPNPVALVAGNNLAVTVTVTASDTTTKTYTLNITRSAPAPTTITNPSITPNTGTVGQDLVLTLSNTAVPADVARFITDISILKYGSAILTRDDSATSGLGKYKVNGSQIIIFKENITTIGSTNIDITAPNAVTSNQIHGVTINPATTITNPSITPNTGTVGQDLVLTLSNTAVPADVARFLTDISILKYGSATLTRDDSATSGLGKYKVNGSQIIIFKENITTIGSTNIDITAPNAVTSNQIHGVTINPATAITNPTITPNTGTVGQDLVLTLSNTAVPADVARFLTNISSLKYNALTLTRDDGVISGAGKYKISGNQIIIFKENITATGSKGVEMTVNGLSGSASMQHNVVIAPVGGITNPTVAINNSKLNQDLVLEFSNTNATDLALYLSSISELKYGTAILTPVANTATSGLGNYKVDGNKITIFKENITTTGSVLVSITVPTAVTAIQTLTVTIASGNVLNPIIRPARSRVNKDLVLYLYNNTNTNAVSDFMTDITTIKYGTATLTKDNSVSSGLGKYKTDGNKIIIFKENVTTTGNAIITLTAPNAPTQNQAHTVNITTNSISNPSISSSRTRVDNDLEINFSGGDTYDYLNDITVLKYGNRVLTRDDSVSKGLDKFKVSGRNIIIFKENITTTGYTTIYITAPNANDTEQTHRVEIYKNNNDNNTGTGSPNRPNHSGKDKDYLFGETYTKEYTLKNIDNLRKSDSSGHITVNYLGLNYKLPHNIINIIPGLNDFISKKDYSLSDLSLRVTIETLTSKEFKNLEAAYDKTFKGKLVSNPYKVYLTLYDKNNKKIDFDMNTFNEPISFTLDTNDLATTVFKYDTKNDILMFTPAILKSSEAKVNTKNHSIYVAAKNNISFSDVSSSAWYYSQVINAANKGLVFGMGNNVYQPNREVTRAEFVQMIVKALQLPEHASKTKEYSDTSTRSWYYDPIMRAKSYGLLDSFTDGNFKPDQAITREEMASILAAAIKKEDIAVTSQYVDLSSVYTDSSQISSSRKSDIELVYKLKIMQGMNNGKFEPNGSTTRAQAATVQLNLLIKSGSID